MSTDREVKVKEIKIYFKRIYSHIIDKIDDDEVQFLWDLLNGRSEDTKSNKSHHYEESI